MKSIQRHLAIWLLASLGVVLVGGGAVAHWAARTAMLDELDGKLLAQARALMAQVEQNHEDIEFNIPPDLMAAPAGAPPPFLYTLWFEDGSLFARSPALGNTRLPRLEGTLQQVVHKNLSLQGFPPLRMLVITFQPRTAGPARKLAAGGSLNQQDPSAAHEGISEGRPPTFVPAKITLALAADRSPLEAASARLRAILAMAGLCALLTGIAAIRWVLKRSLAPLTRLGEHAASINAETLHHRFATEDMPDELVPIVQRLNDLLERLAASFERERRFSSDLAHEFRTPLAELRILAELELSRPSNSRKEVLSEVLEITHHLEALAGRMLALARAEQGQMQPDLQICSVVDLIAEVMAPLEARAEARSLQWEFKVPADARAWRIQTDPLLLRSLLGNLLENAVSHAPEGSHVKVSLISINNSVSVTVSNPAPDLTPADVSHLAERFWRKDAARTASPHFGLGLSLARVFAQVLGCQLVLHLDALGWLNASVEGVPRVEWSASSPLVTHKEAHGPESGD